MGPINSMLERHVLYEVAVPGHLVTNQGADARSLKKDKGNRN